jgi:adenylate kinase family enzyme
MGRCLLKGERYRSDLNTLGDSAVGEKVAEDVSLRLDLPHISVNRIVSGRAKDPKFLHHGVIQICLDKGFDMPAGLVVDLIECEIKGMGDRPWTIISGFPNDKEQLEYFE